MTEKLMRAVCEKRMQPALPIAVRQHDLIDDINAEDTAADPAAPAAILFFSAV